MLESNLRDLHGRSCPIKNRFTFFTCAVIFGNTEYCIVYTLRGCPVFDNGSFSVKPNFCLYFIILFSPPFLIWYRLCCNTVQCTMYVHILVYELYNTELSQCLAKCVAEPERFEADPDPDPTFYVDTDPDTKMG